MEGAGPMYDNMIMGSEEFVSKLMNVIDANTFNTNDKLYNTWRKVVASVNNYGERLTAHSHPTDLKNGSLLIETDHPGWIQILQMNSRYILNGLKMYAPELKITSLVFKLESSTGKLYDSYEQSLEKSRAAMEKTNEQNEKATMDFYEKMEKSQKIQENSDQPVKIEGELADKLEKLRRTMLTSTKEK